MREDRLWERFWISQNFPGLPGFGMIESGAIWNGPMTPSISAFDKGPRYLPVPNSQLRMVEKAEACSTMEELLGGVYV